MLWANVSLLLPICSPHYCTTSQRVWTRDFKGTGIHRRMSNRSERKGMVIPKSDIRRKEPGSSQKEKKMAMTQTRWHARLNKGLRSALLEAYWLRNDLSCLKRENKHCSNKIEKMGVKSNNSVSFFYLFYVPFRGRSSACQTILNNSRTGSEA